MASFITIILIGISLSMDAFSLSLAYGMTTLKTKEKLILTIIVGLYHFIMPLIGLNFGTILSKINLISINLIATIILAYIGIDLIISNTKEEEKPLITIPGFFLFGLSVSIDSLSVGIGLKAITNSYYLSSIIFSISSATFTYLGLTLGTILGKKIGSYSKTIGGIILIIIAILIFLK